MSPDDLLARLRVLFGIPVDDDTHDAELTALFGVALAAARTYTGRWLYPVAKFRETVQPAAGCCRSCGCAPVLLAEVPVQSVESATRDGTDVDPTLIVVNAAGAVYEKHGALVFPLAPFSTFELVYLAGYDEIPADLAEALCQVAASAGGATVTAAGGTPSAAPVKKFTVFDVGAVEYATAAGSFYSAEVPTEGAPNAILGPWVSILDAYRDLGKTLGHNLDDCLHEVANLGPVPPPGAAARVAPRAPGAVAGPAPTAEEVGE